jgi:hypothetical protein
MFITHHMSVLTPYEEVREGTLLAYDVSPSDSRAVRLELNFEGDRIAAESAEGYFAALLMIRSKFEPGGYGLLCYGASRDVYPAPMSVTVHRVGVHDKHEL